MKNFMLLLAGLAVSYIGDSIYMASLSIVIYQHYHSAALVTLLWVSRTSASLLVLIVAGSIIDRMNAKKFMYVNDWVRAILVISIPFVLRWPTLIFVMVFLLGGLGTSYGSALRVMLKYYSIRITSEKVNSYFSVTYWLGEIIGTGLSGALIILFSENIPFVYDSLSFIVCGFITYTVRYDAPKSKLKFNEVLKASHPRGVISDLIVSAKIVSGSPVLLLLFISSSLFTIGESLIDGLQVVFTSWLHLSAAEYGYVGAVERLGLLIGSVFLSMIVHRLNKIRVFYVGLILSIIGIGLYVTSFNLWSILAFVFVLGIGITVYDIAFMNLQQQTVSQDLIARVSNAMAIGPKIASIFSMGIGGVLSNIWGVRNTLIGVAALTIFGLVLSMKSSYSSVGNEVIKEVR